MPVYRKYIWKQVKQCQKEAIDQMQNVNMQRCREKKHVERKGLLQGNISKYAVRWTKQGTEQCACCSTNCVKTVSIHFLNICILIFLEGDKK